MITSEAVRAPLPTSFGVFDVHAFETACGHIYLAMVHGDLGDGATSWSACTRSA